VIPRRRILFCRVVRFNPSRSAPLRNVHGSIGTPIGADGNRKNWQTVPLVSGEYEVSGKSRGASTAKRTVGGAAVGSIIGALAGGGKGAAIGAGVGGAAGAGSEIITKGDQVKVLSETLPPKCPPAWASAVTARLDYFRLPVILPQWPTANRERKER
jgi:hypothetical protein